MSNKISVIIPIYKAADFIGSCIESVLVQRGCDFEIILVNDGSPDDSLGICQQYAKRDSRIKVFDKPNGGVSSARNMGLDNATGEWVLFLDADDKLTPDAFSIWLPYMDDYEVIRSAAGFVYADRISPRHIRFAADRDESFAQTIGHKSICAIWSGIYRRSLFVDHNIRFDTSLTYGEDWLVLSTLLYHCRSVKTLPTANPYLYNRYNDSNCTNTMIPDKLIQSLVVVTRLRQLVGEGRYTKELRYSRCRRVGILIKHFGYAATAEALMSSTREFDMITLRDILLSTAHLSLRVRLLRLWFGHLGPRLRKQGE